MADLPPDPDAPLTEDAFDGLDLGTLTDGVHATGTQWGAIATAAGRRRQRRTWSIAAAALVVLLLGTSVVVLSRNGSDDGVQIAAGGGDRTEYLLPPEDSSPIALVDDQSSWFIQYQGADGRAWLLSNSGISGFDPDYEGPVPFGTAVQLPRFGLTFFQCTAELSGGIEPIRATWGSGGTGASLISTDLVRFYESLPPRTETPCEAPTGPVDELAQQMASLRTVSKAEWDAYFEEHADVRSSSPTSSIPILSADTTSTTVTIQEDPPADPRTAEEQIAAAVAGLQDRDADGSYPNLEDGVSRAGQYASAFALAAAQSGADQVADPRSGPFTLRDLTFTSSERATITFDAGAHLPSGDFTFAIPGTAILQDGRWVLSYDTIAAMVGRACLPPGGVTSVCVKGRND